MLNKTGRRWLRIIHIVLVAFLMGGLLSIFVISRLSGLDLSQLYIANFTMYTLFNGVVTYSFYGIVTTGLIYSVFTHWGLTKHWWIIAKWIGTLSVFTLVWVWLGPAINGMVSLSDAGLARESDHFLYYELAQDIGPSILTALVIFMTLIVITIFRPWGQRSQAYALRRGTILLFTGFAVVVSIGFGALGYYDLESYRKMEISTPDLTQIPDGVYQGSATYAGFEYVVDVSVASKKIVDLKMVGNRDSPYAGYSEGVLPRILKAQSPNVNGITGATTTSKMLMRSIELALEGAIK